MAVKPISFAIKGLGKEISITSLIVRVTLVDGRTVVPSVSSTRLRISRPMQQFLAVLSELPVEARGDTIVLQGMSSAPAL